MTKIGKFFEKKFKNKEVEVFTSNENEYIHYADTDMFSWTIITGIFIEYDEESGVLVFETNNKKRFYLNEFKIELFWEPGFDYRSVITTSINGPSKKKRDFM